MKQNPITEAKQHFTHLTAGFGGQLNQRHLVISDNDTMG